MEHSYSDSSHILAVANSSDEICKPSPKPKPSTTVLKAILISTCVALSVLAAAAFGSIISSHSAASASPAPPIRLRSTTHAAARPPSKLKRPAVLMVSCDGFRFGYQFKTDTPNIHRLIKGGTSAELGLIPSYPTLTFPNHYAIATGLYPESHGIINNYFTDPTTGEEFTTRNHDPKWWLGEPLWEVAAKNGLKAATYFWPGSEVKKGSWDCPKAYCPPYNGSVQFEERIDTILSYFDLPSDQVPSFINLYLSDPDSQGHKVGPDDPQITEAVAHIDRLIGRLIDGLEKRGIFEDVHTILLGDHGMVGTCDKKVIFLDDLADWVRIPEEWVQSYYPVLAIRPPKGYSAEGVAKKINEGLNSGKVENGEYVKVYLKEELPKRLHYSASERIPPIIGLVSEGYSVEQKRTGAQECTGAHGYDNAYFSMRTIFVAHGPRFARGRKVPSFENVHIFNVVNSILNIEGPPNNGSKAFVGGILLPY